MMGRLLILIFSVCFALAASAADYWVLGSFSVRTNAENEQMRLQELLGTPVTVLYSKHRDSYRVVANAAEIDREALAAHDIETWLMPDISIAATPAAAQTQTDNQAAQPSAPREPPEPTTPAMDQESADSDPVPPPVLEPDVGEPVEQEWEPLYPPLRPGENLADYCDRLPDSPLCTDPRSQELLERARKLQIYRSRGNVSCESMRNEKLQATCREIHGQ